MQKIAVFPGSFDPITIGHVDIVQRAALLFDTLIVAIGINSQKKYLFELEQRLTWIKACFTDLPNVSVETYTNLTINYCRDIGASYLVRGIRSAGDFEYEKTIAHLNSSMAPEIETLLILSKPEYSSISSTIVREIIVNNGDVSKFVPHPVLTTLRS